MSNIVKSPLAGNMQQLTISCLDCVLLCAHDLETADALQESMAVRVLQAICNSNRTEFLHYAAKHSMHPECHMGGEHFSPKL